MLSNEMGCFFVISSDYTRPHQEARKSVHANHKFSLVLRKSEERMTYMNFT